MEVVVEAGAGAEAGDPDAEYLTKGAKIVAERSEVFRVADIIVQVLGHGANDKTGSADLQLFRRDQVLVGFLRPMGSVESITDIASRGVTSFSVELMPRTTRAQSMDALSSMSTVAGYKAVPIAADALPKLFPMMTTAAGTITPARVLILGVGVAGLQAIATARRLGALVSAFDLRPAVKEQVQSLGARFVELAVEAKDAQDTRGMQRHRARTFTASGANCWEK
jgi:H+-translocating NAD(P) transhydrogenase subunit alpha